MLKVENLSVFYGDIQALWGISFDVEEGQIATIVGANGAGKTTTMRSIAGVLPIASGSITFDGRPIHKLSPHQIVEAGISLIPEGRKLFPRMTVLENLEMGAYHSRARAYRRKALDWVYQLFPVLKERRNQLAGTLSGGEQQMLAIGRGLMSRPRLLLTDEPSLGLAPLLVEELFQVVRQINSEGTTILLVEQNVRHALELSDRAYLLESGRITLRGEGKELLQNDHVRTAYLGL